MAISLGIYLSLSLFLSQHFQVQTLWKATCRSERVAKGGFRLRSVRLRLERLGDDSERRQRPCGGAFQQAGENSPGGAVTGATGCGMTGSDDFLGSWVDCMGKNLWILWAKIGICSILFNNSYSWWCYVSNFQIGHNYFQLWLGMDKNGNIMGIEWIWVISNH